jgi:SAM-dependent MidA family methyltransferase
VRYAVIEPFANPRLRQQSLLGDRKVTWVSDIDDLPPFAGVHLSNELFDALPFDLVESDGRVWKELLVDLRNGGFAFTPGDAVEGPPVGPAGFRREVPRGQAGLLEALARKMRAGFLLALDYGMTEGELLRPHLADGTLACYKGHRRDSAPLEDVGLKDITAHVDFTALAREAATSGFRVAGYTDQHHFLVGASTELLLSMDGRPPGPAELKLLRSLRMLLHPETMGTRFKVLLLAKDVADSPGISGFRHQRTTDDPLAA